MSKLNEANEILRLFGLPPQQQNERSAYTLLALCGLHEKDRWADTKAPLVRIVDIIDWMKNISARPMRLTAAKRFGDRQFTNLNRGASWTRTRRRGGGQPIAVKRSIALRMERARFSSLMASQSSPALSKPSSKLTERCRAATTGHETSTRSP